MADVNLGQLEGDVTRAIKAYIAALINKAAEQINGQPVEPAEDEDRIEDEDPGVQGVHSGGGRSGGPFNPDR
jgi:hypothetical protein